MLETLYRHINMVRLSASALAAVAVMVVATGCTGLIDGSSDGLTPAQRAARVKWENEAYPVVRDTCVACHGGSRPMIDFASGATATEVHDRIMAYDPPVVNLDAVASSRLLTKGQHDGPALINDQPTAILDWLQAERDAQQTGSGSGSNAGLEVAPFNVQICTGGQPDNANGTCPTNHIDISMIAMAPNVEISFIAQALGSGLYLTDLKLAGGAMGAYIEHPLFVSHPAMGDPVPDQIDRYFNLKMNLMPSTNDQIAGGTAAFVNFVATDKISIHFKAVSAYQSGTTGGGPTGCKVVQSFTMNAAGPLNQNCASCHAGGNQNATSAMDLTGVGNTGDANMQLTVCNQVRTRINFTTPDQSGFYLAPDPNSATNHQFKFPAGGFTTFKSAVDPWVNAERTAP